MKNRFESGYTVNPLPLVVALTMGTIGVVCVKDCHENGERVRVRAGVLQLQNENSRLDEQIGSLRRSGPVVIMQSCKMAYDLCMNSGKLSEGCSLEREDEACDAAALTDVKSIEELKCCRSIQTLANSCKQSYADCVKERKITKL